MALSGRYVREAFPIVRRDEPNRLASDRRSPSEY